MQIASFYRIIGLFILLDTLMDKKQQPEEKIDTIEGLARLVKRGFDEFDDKFTNLDGRFTKLEKDIVDIKSDINWIKKDVVQLHFKLLNFNF